MKGPCYPAAEALYHAMGGKDAGLTPMRIVHEGAPHWYLRWQTAAGTLYLDPTLHLQGFSTVPDYTAGRGCGFLTKEPSRRALAYAAL